MKTFLKQKSKFNKFVLSLYIQRSYVVHHAFNFKSDKKMSQMIIIIYNIDLSSQMMYNNEFQEDDEPQNLLDLPISKIDDHNVYNFAQFKDWFNHYDLPEFNMLQTNPNRALNLIMPTSNQSKRLLRKSIDLTVDRDQYHLGGGGGKLKSSLSIAYNTIQNNMLAVDDAKSYHSSIKESSAHSSRSFNGYQQINQYQIRDKLGKGAFSQVYLGVNTQNNKKYAIKIFNNKHLKKKLFRKNSTQMIGDFVSNQIAILKKLNHPYVAKLFEVISDDQNGRIFLILEFYQKGYINRNHNGTGYKRLLQSQCKRYFKQLALALDYIHNYVKIAHRDIKPQNILLSENDECKLSDFGLSTGDMNTIGQTGTKAFLPPQVNDQSDTSYNTQAVDIWSLGVTLIALLTGKIPDLTKQSEVNQSIQSLKGQYTLPMINFIQKCLKINPEERIKAKDILKQKWLIGTGQPLKNHFKDLNLTISQKQQKQAIQKKSYCKTKRKDSRIEDL